MMMDCSGLFFVNRKVTKVVTTTAGIRRLARRSGTTVDPALRLLPFKSKAQAHRALQKNKVTKARLGVKRTRKNRGGLPAMLLKWQQQLLQQDSARAGRNISLWPILLGQNNSDPIPNSPLFPRKLIQQSACAEVSSNTTYSEHQYPNFDHTRSQPATTVTDMMEDKVGGFVSNLCSPSTLATRLGLIPTPQREAYISSLLSNAKCSETFHQVIEPAQRSLNFAITPRTLPQPPTSHPFHHHLPHYNNGQHRNVGKDVMTFNLCRASKAAANEQKNFEKARLISAGDKRGFEFIEADQTRSKFKEEQLSMFEQWIIKDCELVKQNPLKNDMIIQRDRRGKVVLGHDNQPIMIQKMLLMSSYRELHLYMIDNYRDMMMDNGTVLFSECTLRKIMPR
jgi:hypothetical protein